MAREPETRRVKPVVGNTIYICSYDKRALWPWRTRGFETYIISYRIVDCSSLDLTGDRLQYKPWAV
ncbi:hypothetical protein CC1G_13549 [Coprinopsis cinerea okayama7|uniref:Uncharacterized protein n=1 Tax=Coprinopsis cinerea (strain Okayama-7 / 130 / ATCC MYA-4618 / FGSC 9003) TaxID=240176 RepID=D6RJZ3_COPC7|nr:hypothetical protein CC1G_13549 [Coprinopsis cinerea okayama7\|eukprot:XP_002912021.1 hypothetical protein CC1G_13549 [Coprinopsis cinerea okayama7\